MLSKQTDGVPSSGRVEVCISRTFVCLLVCEVPGDANPSSSGLGWAEPCISGAGVAVLRMYWVAGFVLETVPLNPRN